MTARLRLDLLEELTEYPSPLGGFQERLHLVAGERKWKEGQGRKGEKGWLEVEGRDFSGKKVKVKIL